MSNLTHEIVTLQVGHYASFVGTHWWNCQESSFIYDPSLKSVKEINHDVMFREGKNLMGEVTYTPRLVLFDLKGSLNTLKQEGRLYDVPEVGDDVSWSCDITMHKSASLPKNDFLKDLDREEASIRGTEMAEATESEDQELDIDDSERVGEPQVFGTKLYDLDRSVSVWSDFLRLHLHPRTVHVVTEYQHVSESDTFDLYSMGAELYKDRRTQRDMEDRIHFFIEECDHLQGLHILADTHNGFGGLTAGLLQDLEDELDNKSLMVYGVSPPSYGNTTPVQDSYRLMNMALTFEKLANHSSAFIPLSLASSLGRKPGPSVVMPHLNYNVDLPYHTSALLAASLDTNSLPYRQEGALSLLPHLTQSMAQGGRKVLGLYSSLPFPFYHDSTLADSLLNLGDTLPWQPMTPGCHSNMPCSAQSLVVRGLPPGRLKAAPKPGQSRVLDHCDTLDELLSIYLQEMCDCKLNAICSIQEPCKVSTPFPHVFSQNVNSQGFISNLERPKDKGVDQIPIMTSLQTTSAIKRPLQELLEDVKKIDVRRHHRLLESNLEEDDYSDILNNLQTLVDTYEDTPGVSE